nr:hypothetical protein [Streptomyces rubradiris]
MPTRLVSALICWLDPQRATRNRAIAMMTATTATITSTSPATEPRRCRSRRSQPKASSSRIWSVETAA